MIGKIVLILAVFLATAQLSDSSMYEANVCDALSAPVKTSEVSTNVAYYALFASHQSKEVTIGSWTYVAYTTGGPMSNSPAYWRIARSSDLSSWQPTVDYGAATSYQPPQIVKVNTDRIGVLFGGEGVVGLFYSEYAQNADGSLTLVSGPTTVTSGTAAYFSGEVDPTTHNLIAAYWDGAGGNWIVRRMGGTWESPRLLAYATDKIILYTHFFLQGGILHLAYTQGHLGGSAGNYTALDYMRSRDFGLTWENASELAIPTPFVEGTEAATTVGPDTTSSNQYPLALVADRFGNAHLAFTAADGTAWYGRIDAQTGAVSRTQVLSSTIQASLVVAPYDPATLYYVAVSAGTPDTISVYSSYDTGYSWAKRTSVALPWPSTATSNALYALNFAGRLRDDGRLAGLVELRDLDPATGQCAAPGYCRVESITVDTLALPAAR